MSDANPYRPPDAIAQEVTPPAPGVWYGYMVYCILMALLYGALLAGGIVLAVVTPVDDPEAAGAVFAGVFMGVIGLVFALPYAAAPLLPRRPWTWVVGIVLIAIGMTSCLTLPFCIPLLLYWFKPANQAYFGKTPRPTAAQRSSVPPPSEA